MRKTPKRTATNLVSHNAALNPHDRMVASLVVQVEILAKEAMATSAIEGITMDLQDARQAAYNQVVGRWLAQQGR
jgi:hypothetical protein